MPKESHSSLMPNSLLIQKPFSPMITKYTKNPAEAWIIPICPYAILINLKHKTITCTLHSKRKTVKLNVWSSRSSQQYSSCHNGNLIIFKSVTGSQRQIAEMRTVSHCNHQWVKCILQCLTFHLQVCLWLDHVAVSSWCHSQLVHRPMR